MEIKTATPAANSSTNFKVTTKRENFTRLVGAVYRCYRLWLGAGMYNPM
jgi:hypothetical protein